MTVHVNGSVSVVTHKVTELNKSCKDTILKVLSTVMNENRRNKVFTVIKQQKTQEYSKDSHYMLTELLCSYSLNFYMLTELLCSYSLNFKVCSVSNVLHSVSC